MKNNFFRIGYCVLGMVLMLNTAMSRGQQNKNKKTTLGLLTWEALNKEDNYKEAALITNTIKELFVESKKYVPLDRSLYSETAKFSELEAQKNIAYINGIVAKQGRQKGAVVLVGGEVSAVEYIELNSGVQCKMTFTININDVETGELIATKIFKPGLTENIPKADGVDKITARNTRMILLRNKINNFIISNTPFFAKIIELEKEGKNTNVLLEVGEDQGISEGDRFVIYQIKKYGKKTRKLEVVKIGVTDVQGDFSIAKIPKKQVKELETLMNDENVNLICQQTECKFCFNKVIN